MHCPPKTNKKGPSATMFPKVQVSTVPSAVGCVHSYTNNLFELLYFLPLFVHTFVAGSYMFISQYLLAQSSPAPPPNRYIFPPNSNILCPHLPQKRYHKYKKRRNKKYYLLEGVFLLSTLLHTNVSVSNTCISPKSSSSKFSSRFIPPNMYILFPTAAAA